MAVISPGEPFHLRAEPPIEWVQNWYLVRETGVLLFGEPATSLIPPVEWAEFAGASARYATDLARRDLSGLSPGGLAYTVLTLCRAEETLLGGRHTSKQEAAAIAELRHPESAAVIRDALRCRLARGNEGSDDGAFRSAAMTFIGGVSRSLADHGDAITSRDNLAGSHRRLPSRPPSIGGSSPDTVGVDDATTADRYCSATPPRTPVAPRARLDRWPDIPATALVRRVSRWAAIGPAMCGRRVQRDDPWPVRLRSSGESGRRAAHPHRAAR